MQATHLLLFGIPTLQVDGLLSHIKPSKPNALVCYLAAQQGRLVSRTRLLSLFWEESPEREGRRALTTTLGRIQHTWPGVRIITHGDSVRLEPDSSLEVDVDFYGRWQLGLNVPSSSSFDTPRLGAEVATSLSEPVRALSALVGLYRGEFMAEFHLPRCPSFDTWLIDERRVWEYHFVDSLARLTQLEETEESWVALEGHARQALAILPHDERFYRSLMLALAMKGDRAGALAQYDQLQFELARDLAVKPEAKSTLLRDAIKLGNLAGRDRHGPAVAELESASERPWPATVPVVGRAEQAATLTGILFSHTLQPQIALVLGELGTGKSLLVTEVLAHAPTSLTVLTGRCYADHSRMPYAPVIQVLRAALAVFNGDSPPLDEVWLTEVKRLLPELVPAVEIGPDAASDPLRLYEGIARFLAAVPGRLIVVLEDLHWADEASVLALAYLLRSSVSKQVKIVATTRFVEAPAEIEKLLAQLEREGRLQRIHVSDLTLLQVEELVAAIVGHKDTDLSAVVFAETNGHPFFTVALVQTLKERRGTALPQTSPLPVPSSVESLIYTRMARFSAEARHLAVALSIFPQGATLNDLAVVTGLSADLVAELVEPALREGILHEQTETARTDGPQDPGVRFSHELVRKTVLGTVSNLRQSLLHGRMVDLKRNRLSWD